MDALIKDREQLVAMIDSVPSVDNLDFIMESDALGHTVMDQRQGHQSLVVVAETVTLEEVNSTGAEVLEFIFDFGKPTAPLHIDGSGEVDFDIHPNEITDVIKTGLQEPIHAEPAPEVPKELISPSQLEELRLNCRPSFVPLAEEVSSTKLFDKETGITQRRLSNGIPVNYKVELFCVNHMINCSLESTEEFICMEFRFTLRDNGMRATFQLLHMVLEHSVWLEDAFDRARQLYLSYYHSIPKSLERSTAHKLMLAMLDGDDRFVEPTPQSLQRLTLQAVKDAVMNQFSGENMEVSIVGDFAEEDIESCILDYLGTVGAAKKAVVDVSFDSITFGPSPSDLHFQQLYLKDTDERACAYIASPTPNRWGFSAEGEDLFELINGSVIDKQFNSEGLVLTGDKDVETNPEKNIRRHPLFFGISLGLLAEIINSRISNFYSRQGFKVVDACKNVLRGLHDSKIVQRELDRAKRTLLMRHEAEAKSNAYWLGLLAHLQSASVPRKDISCIKDLTLLYEAATVEDLYLAYQYLKVDDASLFSCVGVAGAKAIEDLSAVADEVLEIGHQELPSIGRDFEYEKPSGHSCYLLSSLYLVSDDGKTLVICINCLTKIVLCHFKGWKVLEDPTHVYEYMKLLFNRESFIKTKPTKEHVIAGRLRRANFTSADMRESDFSGCSFNGAYLEKAVAYKANFSGADLSDTLMDRMDPVVIIELKTFNGCTTKITA
ncbi:hypothetical protein J5N97_021522 [Dioscorea zingiberensis]|uniref:Peptidase M16 C-terminal domain-containing protein n=1 Tax=Dioscorea zingiberensis TaxID=325984 RepID=A0A9D5HEP2_9LILI|nr:hypothetical protein J5N97_021522 [Dioscorea zingiberensis]